MHEEATSLVPVLIMALGVLVIAVIWVGVMVNQRLSSINRKLHRIESNTRQVAGWVESKAEGEPSESPKLEELLKS